jgi:predicted aspartyl protease
VISAARSSRFPYLTVHVRLGNVQYPDVEFSIDALVDTGFDGGLTVPQALIPARVARYGEHACRLADGSTAMANAYLGFVSVGALQPIGTLIIALPHQALLGRAVTDHFRLTFFYGRQVILES